MRFDPVIAAVRFGTGRSPAVPDPDGVPAMLARLAGPDAAAAAHPIPGLDAVAPSVAALRAANRARRDAAGTAGEVEARDALRALNRAAQRAAATNAMRTLARAATTADGLRERLTWFWADHFTVRSRQGPARHLVSAYVQDAIRPHLAGRFADMLRAAVTHPVMLTYLDQVQSVGPGSLVGQRRGRGLNENLARELLELHTLGVSAAYGQRDVTELAELLTGLSVDGDGRFRFRQAIVEPGAETVLGETYGGTRRGALEAIHDALDDLAAHPATAAHLARKLAVHFVADDPPPDLVAALTARWRDTGGDLLAVTEALLTHPEAWRPEPRKVKPPLDFIASALRALAVPPETLLALSLRDLRRLFHTPLIEMGQPWEAPPGPDGWPEAAEAWITPQGMATRITWAMSAPAALRPDLPDPRAFAETALGPAAPQAVRFAAGAAETVAEGVGVVLASAAFNRR